MADQESALHHERGRKEPHLRDYLSILMRRRWLFIGVVVMTVVCALIYVQVQTPIYRARCQLLLQLKRPTVMQVEAVYDPTFGAEAGGAIMRRQFLETQYRLMLSRPLLRKTFEEMGFAETEEFAGAKDPIRSFKELFAVRGIRNSLLAEVTFEWRDRALARDTLARLIEYYMESQRSRALGIGEQGLKELLATAEKLRPELAAKAEEVEQFVSKYKMVSMDEDVNVVSQRLQELSQEHTAAQTKRIAAESRYSNILAALTTQKSPDEMPEAVDSQSVRDLKLEYVKAKLHCSDIEDGLGPNHPEVKAARAALKTIGDKLEMEVRSVLASAQAQFIRGKREEEDLRALKQAQEKLVMEFNTVRAKYRPLRDAYTRLNETYSAVVKRISEIRISMASSARDAGVFVSEEPELPARPAKPRKRIIVGLAGIMGILLALGLCFFVDYLDTSIKTKDEIEELTGAAVLGYVPEFEEGLPAGADGGGGALELLPLRHSRSAAAEGFRTIRTALAFTRRGSKRCTQITVTSALPSEGKTLVSVNVALALAQTGKRVLLFDADLRRPRIHKIFGGTHVPGASNLFSADDELTLDDVIRSTDQENLSILPSGPIPPNPAELLNSPRMGEIIEQLSERFDYVVYDTSPVINVTDSAVLSERVDGALLVVRCFVTDRAAVAHARELLDGAEARLLGVVVNGVDAPRGGQEYEKYYYRNYYYQYSDDGSPKRKVRREKETKATA